jgi:signal transduction histidine kinase
VFTGLRSRLMLSFAALLVVCLCIVTVTLTALFFGWVSFPQLAYTQLADAAVPALTRLRDAREAGQSPIESLTGLGELTQERGIRVLLITIPDGTILADTDQAWVGSKIPLEAALEDAAFGSPIRGRARGPDQRWLFYMALPAQDLRRDPPRRAYLVLVTTVWETVRPFVGSVLISVLVSGMSAFALSILFALWLAGTLSRPLQHAAVAAEQVAAGDYTASLQVAVPDEARRLAESFNAMTRAVASSQRAQRDFVTNVSHELRTPLTSIRGFAQAILDGTASDGPSIRRAATVIHDEADRLSRMAHKLLDLTRLESGEISMSWRPIDLSGLLQACLDRFALAASEEGIVLRAQIAHGIAIVGDGDRLLQVFTNLLDNALKHTDRGGRVTMSAASTGDQVLVSVADTGCGISEDDLPRVFERFYQVDKSRFRSQDTHGTGFGLGLAISDEIVRAHGGQIDVQSIIDVGTQFTVTLPHRPLHDRSAQVRPGGAM